MKVIYTKHALLKFDDLADFGIEVAKTQIKKVITNPKYKVSEKGVIIAADLFL